MPAAALAVVPTAPLRRRNGSDNDHPFRFGSHFHYLTGFAEPDAWLALDGAAAARRLLLRPRDPAQELWDGARLGPDAAPAALGVDAALPVDAARRAHRRSCWSTSPRCGRCSAAATRWTCRVERWLGAGARQGRARGRERRTRTATSGALLDEMRLVKDAHEIATMRRAGEIAAAAHVRAMRLRAAAARRHCASTSSKPSCCTNSAATARQAPAYESIVAGGANACVLHYPAGDAELRDGELCLIDAGCEMRRLRQRRHAHLPGQRPLQRGAARALRHRAGRAGGGDRRDAARRAQAGRALGRGARLAQGTARR